MINSPEQMLVAFDNTLSLIPTTVTVPQDTFGKIQELYNQFQDDYYFFPWGAEKKGTWDDDTKIKWNNNFNTFSSLVKSALADPRTKKKAPAPKIQVTTKTPVQQVEPEFIFGKIPPKKIPVLPILPPPPAPVPTTEPFNYWWLVGGAAALGAIALMLGKKTTKPALAGFGMSPNRHMDYFNKNLMAAIKHLRHREPHDARYFATSAETHLLSAGNPSYKDALRISRLARQITEAEQGNSVDWDVIDKVY